MKSARHAEAKEFEDIPLYDMPQRTRVPQD